jgi:hypothetical protein
MQPKCRSNMLRSLREFVIARPGARCCRHRQREHAGRLRVPNCHGMVRVEIEVAVEVHEAG